MAIEIRELLIKVKIEDPVPSAPSEIDLQGSKESPIKEFREEIDLQGLKESLIRECREEIKRQIRNSRDR
jgi:hypothetical protein